MQKLLCCLIYLMPQMVSVCYADQKPRVEFLNSGEVLPTTRNLPFSEAVRVDNTIYLSGQLGTRPGTLNLVEGGIAAEAKQALTNIRTSLDATGLSMKHVVKCTVMLADVSEWPAFNEVYQTFFSEPYPARSAFGASGLALGARTEIECLAVDYQQSLGNR